MRISWLAAGTAILLLSGAQSSVMSQTPARDTQETAVRDPETLAALDKMGAALRKLQIFGVHLDTTQETVLTTGQKVQIGGAIDYRIRRPNGMRVDMVTDREARSLYYDGKTLTLDSPRLGFYAQVDKAPPTIRGALTMVATNYGIETPLADLFTWGENPELQARIKSAFYVGAETIDGLVCDQYAMRQENVDWQVWIRRGVEALPCKMVITSTDDPSMPQYSAVLTWTPRANYPASDFTFAPTKDSRKIAFKAAPAGTATVD